MSAAAIRPRYEQIDELTRGLQLPLPAISSDHLKVIAEGLATAFKEILNRHPAQVGSGTEAEVTALMEACLNRMLDKDPLWGQLVSNVARGKESLSYDGSHLEKRPDLSIFLSDRSRGFPLVAEAKIIDHTMSKTVKLYCDNGIRRFVEGEYAWGNREAFMIAYVRDGSLTKSKLIPFLAAAITLVPRGYLVEPFPALISSGAIDLATSQHSRKFNYLERSSQLQPPGSISLWHLWLK